MVQLTEWSQIRALFEAALAVEGPARREWLSRRTHPQLVEEVLALLAADAAESTPLDDPAAFLHLSLTGDAASSTAPVAAGERLGSFEIRGVLGTGRSGVVYRAWQVFPPREVAFKLIHTAIWNGGSPARFETEVRALARLDHPNIARVLETGTIPEPGGVQRPYLVMELVSSPQPVTRFARDLAYLDRLQLLEQLCAAMEHAHRNGVLHRDLKPGNVLVGADGLLKVIDFGIARIEEDSDHATLTGQLLGTPAYMSPEQLRGGATDTRTDVHAIGLIGREMLGDESLRGDLRIVLDKATEQDPADRYQSVAELSQELARIREHRVIHAREASAAELMLKFARRHRGMCAVAGFVVLVIVVAAAALLYFAARTARANADARDVASFMLDRTIDRLEDRIGSATERRELAQTLLGHVERLALRSDDLEVEESLARLHRVLGDDADARGDLEAARIHLETSLESRERLADAVPESVQRKADLSLALVRVGDLAGQAGNREVQRARYQSAMQLDRQLAASQPDDPHLVSNLIYSLLRTADLALKDRQPDAARALAREQLALAKRIRAMRPDDTEWLWEVVHAQSWVAKISRECDVELSTEASLSGRFAIAMQLGRDNPDSRRFAVRTISLQLELTNELCDAGRMVEAVAIASKAVENARHLGAADATDISGLAWIARTHAVLAVAFARSGKAEEFGSNIGEAKSACGQFAASRGHDWETVDVMTSVLRHEGDGFVAIGRVRDAARSSRETAVILRALKGTVVGEAHEQEVLLRLRCALAAVWDPTPEERLELDAVTQELGDSHVGWRQLDLAEQLRQHGRCDEAMAVLRRGVVVDDSGQDPLADRVRAIEAACSKGASDASGHRLHR